uniref:Uncharacterized protein n=1 Tax=Davidia involucrata TaxID=16924 RepID=A0A5B7AQL6_DAVIN
MLEILNHKNSALPYCSAITKIFKYFKVDLKLELDQANPRDDDYYSPKVLRLIGYKIQDGRWQSKPKSKGNLPPPPPPADIDSKPPPFSAPPSSGPESSNIPSSSAPPSKDSLSIITARLDSLTTSLDEHTSAIGVRFDAIDERQVNLEQQSDKLKEQMTSMEGKLDQLLANFSLEPPLFLMSDKRERRRSEEIE